MLLIVIIRSSVFMKEEARSIRGRWTMVDETSARLIMIASIINALDLPEENRGPKPPFNWWHLLL